MRSPAPRARPAPAIDIVTESPLWRAEPEAEAVLLRAVGEAAATAGAPAHAAELAILLCDDAAIRDLNGRWRGRAEPTNVLSFPAAPGTATLGDIAIAFETTAREAEAEGKRFSDHLAHLVVHGFLHLLSYDHQSDDEADAMERLERTILTRLGIADPYAVRDTAT
jgi:probable rRNA maturation factor